MSSRVSIAECGKFLRLFFNKTLISLLLSMFSINAAPLAEHQKNVQTARALTAELSDYIDETETFDDIDAEYEKEIIAKIRGALPAAEKIEWQGATIENGNEWLAAELTIYANEKNLTKRSEILDSIGERLGALEEKLVELENAVAADRTKDEDKQKLAEILRRAEYQKPEPKQESLFQRWWQAFTDWLAGVFPRPKISEMSENGSQSISFVLQILLYALVLGAIGFLLYRFAPVLLKNRRKREKPEKKELVILGERVAAGKFVRRSRAAGTRRRFASRDSQRLHRAFARFARPPRDRFGAAQNQSRLSARLARRPRALRKRGRADRQFRAALVRRTKRR
jgi:hypothetical protein